MYASPPPDERAPAFFCTYVPTPQKVVCNPSQERLQREKKKEDAKTECIVITPAASQPPS